MASTSEYKTARLDVEENVEKAPPDVLRHAGPNRPSGLEVRATLESSSHPRMTERIFSDIST
jgi:hypothetical protein